MNDPAIEAARRTLAAWGEPETNTESAATALTAAREALAPIRELHKPWPLWDECEHLVGGDPLEIGTKHQDGKHVYINEVGWTCKRLYDICSECCTDDIYQSEDCANHHIHGDGKPICNTAKLCYTTEELQ